MRKKMSSDKKMVKAKVVGNFTYQGADFFYFDEISKMWILEPKMSFAKKGL